MTVFSPGGGHMAIARGFGEIDRSIPIAAETGQILNRLNFLLVSRAQIFEGSEGRSFVMRGKKLPC